MSQEFSIKELITHGILTRESFEELYEKIQKSNIVEQHKSNDFLLKERFKQLGITFPISAIPFEEPHEETS